MLWEPLGYMKLLFDCDVLGEGGMRVAKRAEVLENCNHSLTNKFTVGCNLVAKEYTTTVENAAKFNLNFFI